MKITAKKKKEMLICPLEVICNGGCLSPLLYLLQHSDARIQSRVISILISCESIATLDMKYSIQLDTQLLETHAVIFLQLAAGRQQLNSSGGLEENSRSLAARWLIGLTTRLKTSADIRNVALRTLRIEGTYIYSL
jgi:hypothetical protein